MKACTKCNIVKEFNQFHKRNAHPTGYACRCKECTKLKYKNQEYRDYTNNRLKNISEESKEKRRNAQRNYHKRNRVKRNLENKIYREAHKEKIEHNRSLCKEKTRIYSKNHYEKNKKLRSEQIKAYRNKNKERFNDIIKKRIKTDPLFALRKKMSSRIRASMNYGRFNFTKDTMKFIGCDINFLKVHIERQFKKGMNWNNNTKDGWHVDHKIPLASAKTEAELIDLFHYSNLQPLWAKDNLSKGCKILPTQTTMTI